MGSVGALFLLWPDGPVSWKGSATMKSKRSKKVIAYRKSCKAKGVGLSHYILMDKKAK